MKSSIILLRNIWFSFVSINLTILQWCQLITYCLIRVPICPPEFWFVCFWTNGESGVYVEFWGSFKVLNKLSNIFNECHSLLSENCLNDTYGDQQSKIMKPKIMTQLMSWSCNLASRKTTSKTIGNQTLEMNSLVIRYYLSQTLMSNVLLYKASVLY